MAESQEAYKDAEMRRKVQKPAPSPALVVHLVDALWGINDIESIKELNAYDDCNYYFRHSSGEYLLKFYNGVETDSDAILRGFGEFSARIKSRCKHIAVPTVVPSCNGHDLEHCECPLTLGGSPRRIAVRLFHWIHGVTMNDSGASLPLMASVGDAIGRITASLVGFDHDAFHRYHQWDSQRFDNQFGAYVKEPQLQRIIEHVVSHFDHCQQKSHHFRKSVIMGDCNDANIIVNEGKVVGLIDFGDSVYTWTVSEIAIALAYSLCTKVGLADPINTLYTLLSHFCAHYPLNAHEVKYLLCLIQVRLVNSISIGAYSLSKDPDNEYLKLHAQPARDALVQLHSINADYLNSLFHLANTPVSSSGALPIFTAPSLPPAMPSASSTITFVTGNAKKLEETIAIIGRDFPVSIVSHALDLPELQGSPEEVSAEKCRIAQKTLGGAVIVEDTSLCFNAYHGLPGVYIKVKLDFVFS